MDQNPVQFPEGPAAANAPMGNEQTAEGTTGNNTQVPLEEFRKIVKEETAKAFQEIQSMQQRAEARVNKEVEARLKSLQEAGIPVTPEQEKKLVQQTRAQVSGQMQTEDPAPQSGQPHANTSLDPDAAMVTHKANEIMSQVGTVILENDPEAKDVVLDKGPDAFLESVRIQAKKKLERVYLEQFQSSPASKTPMMGGGGMTRPGNPLANITDIDTLYGMANKRR